MPNPMHRPAPRMAWLQAARSSPRCPASMFWSRHAAKQARRPERGDRADRDRQPGSGRPRAPRDGRRRRQHEPRAFLGPIRARCPQRAWGASCWTATSRSRCRRCCCGQTRIRYHPLSVAEEALDLLPDAQLRSPDRDRLPDRLRRPGRRRAGDRQLLRIDSLAAQCPRLSTAARPRRPSTTSRSPARPSRSP